MVAGDILLIVGLFLGFLLGIPAGVWLSQFANKRNWK